MNTVFEQAGPLRRRYAQLQESKPKARIRALAGEMGVSELELVAAGCGQIRPTPLRGPVRDILMQLGELGRVMALTRNEWCVHERRGRYEDVRAGEAMGIVLGPDIDLRLFLAQWRHAWAVDDGGRLSLQFFDAAGGALHKVYVTDETDAAAYQALVRRFADPEPRWPRLEAPGDAPAAYHAGADPAQLRADWLAMRDTHEFHGLLKRHKLARLDALRLAGADLAQQVPADTAERMLGQVAGQDISFMCFVGNPGLIQIHTGPIHKLMRTGPWFNVLDPLFNLHLDTTAIAGAWVVNKPSDDGWITSLECYANTGDLIVQFFGARKPGVPELAEWRALLAGYCPEPLAA